MAVWVVNSVHNLPDFGGKQRLIISFAGLCKHLILAKEIWGVSMEINAEIRRRLLRWGTPRYFDQAGSLPRISV